VNFPHVILECGAVSEGGSVADEIGVPGAESCKYIC